MDSYQMFLDEFLYVYYLFLKLHFLIKLNIYGLFFSYSFDVYTKMECILFMFLIGILFHILSYLALRFRKPKYQEIEIIDDNSKTDIELV